MSRQRRDEDYEDGDTYQDALDIEDTDDFSQIQEKPKIQRSASMMSTSSRMRNNSVEYVKVEGQRICGIIFGSSDRIEINPHWDPVRRTLARILNLHLFECFMGGVILFNIVLIIIETDRRLLCEDPDSPDCAANHADIAVPDLVCLGIYSVELAMRLFVYQCNFCSVRWNIFDLFIVLISILGEFVGSVFADAVIIRVIRMLRLVRMLRLLTAFQELYLMIAAMASTLRTIFWAVVMLVAVLSVCSLIAVDFLRPTVKELEVESKLVGCERCVVAFDSYPQAMVTFFQTLVMGEGVDDLMIPLIEEDWQAALFILIVVAIVYLGFSNLILSVIVDKANEARCSDAFYQALMHKKSRAEARKVLVEFWKKADMNMDNVITLEELRTTYEMQESFRRYFRQMDIDMASLEVAFEVIQNGNGEASFEELADAVVNMKNADITPLISVLKFQMQGVMKEMGNISQKMGALQADLHDQGEMTKNKLHNAENLFNRSASTQDLPRGREEGHVRGPGGGGALATAVADMMCWSKPPQASTDRIFEDEFDRENSEDLHTDDPSSGRRGAGSNGKGLKPFTDRKESPARWSKDYRGSWGSDRGGGRSRSNPSPRQKSSESEEIMAAAAGGKELAALQHQAQAIERDIRNLKSKLATDSGSRRAERREDLKTLMAILADIRGQEAHQKREISAAMGTARDVKESRSQRATQKRWRDIKREMEFSA